MLTHTPLLGAQSTSSASSSLLEFDNSIKVLVDVGWDSSFDRARLAEITQHTSTLSIILLTHATLEHLGAYAHCCKHVPGFSRIPTYATTPVVNLGRTATADLYKSAPPAASLMPKDGLMTGTQDVTTSDILLPMPTQEEIAGYFNRITSLNYSQPHQPNPSPFSPPLNGLTITAYGAGHSLGGTVWHIQYGMESFVYAADWNQSKENLFDGARLLEAGGDEVIEPLQRPTAFICSSRGVERETIFSAKKRDEVLLSLIRETIAQGGNVLIPTDSSSRLMELAFVLNTAWKEHIDGPHSAIYKAARIYMATRSSKATLRNLQSLLEWVEPTVAQQGEAAMTAMKTSDHPLQWTYIKRIERKAQIEHALGRRRSTIILASDSSLEWGFSQQVLQDMAKDERNLVILTEQASGWNQAKTGLGRQLWQFYQSQQGAISNQSNVKIVSTSGQIFAIGEAKLSDLSDEESSAYYQYLMRQNQMLSTMQGGAGADDTAVADVGDEAADESSDSEDDEGDENPEHQGRALNFSAQANQNKRKVGLSDAELGVNILLRSKNVFDFDVRNKRGREKMFPFITRRIRADEFGELIKPEEFLRAEERDDTADGKNGNVSKLGDGAVTGQKRKWDDTNPSQSKKNNSSSPKKLKGIATADDKAPDYYDEVIARATGESSSGATNNGTKADEYESSSDEEDDADESDYEPDEGGAKRVDFGLLNITLNLRIAHVDFSGLAGLTDIVNIVSMMRPRKLIISGGTPSETEMLAEKCRAIPELANAETLTPLLGESVEASMDTDAWTLKLSPELVRRLEWQTTDIKGGEMRIASVSGLLAASEQSQTAKEESDVAGDENAVAAKKVKLQEGAAANVSESREAEKSKALPILTIPPLVTSTNSGTAAIAAQPVRVGELRILDLRAHLINLGHDVAVRGQGTLVVDGSVVVRKIPTTGRLEVECANSGFSRSRGRVVRVQQGGIGGFGRQVLDTRGVFFGVREEVEKALAVVR